MISRHRPQPSPALRLGAALLLGASVAFSPSLAFAAPEEAAGPPSGAGAGAALEDEIVTTEHVVTIGGRRVPFEARTGRIVVRDEKGDAKASVFFVAYLKDGVRDPSERPITFSFNGGPGSSSVWLHLGVLGPWRVKLGPEGFAPPPPYELVANEHSLLDETDLVFIDPVTTGYSRAAPDEDPKQFHGLQEDIESVGDFIRLVLTRFERWSSPKLLVGESYGTTRAAGLAGYLQERHGAYLNGVMLVSSILDFQTARFSDGNDLPYILFLPSYTATAHHHGRLPPDLQSDLSATLEEVEEFALNEYASALLMGDRLSPERRRRVAERLARYTGLSTEYVLSTNLRVHIFRFVKELLRDERLTVGRLDSRYTGVDRDSAGEGFEYDPSYAAILGPFTATLNDLVRRELEFESDLPYEILTSRVRPWSFAGHENRFVNVAETLRGAMSRNPHLKVFVASGLHDLATPYFATEHTLHHAGLTPRMWSNVRVEEYEAGHMMYVRMESLARIKRHLAEFVRDASRQESAAP